MTAIGIDLGGTKIAAQVFDQHWSASAQDRRDTPSDYAGLVRQVADLVAWGDAQAGQMVPVGIGAAGLINPASGLVLAANLAANGQPFPRDIAAAIGRPVTFVNDAHALALSEAVFGQGKGCRCVVAVVLGTGVGGGVALNGALSGGPTLTGGEFGHTAAPAHLVAEHNLPVLRCGCGRMGCIETYIAGPGLARLAKHLTGQDLTPPDIVGRRDADMGPVWALWCALTADLLHRLTLIIDPDLIVLGGGLSTVDGIVADLTGALQQAQFGDFGVPPLAQAEGGTASGARGAAYAAWQASHD